MFKKISQFLVKRPEINLCFGFLMLILLGTLFLILPFSTYKGISFVDALFTATSAICVTGLIVKDTGVDFTIFGQVVILTLIQLGALGIMIGAVFVLLLIKKKLSLSFQAGVKQELGVGFGDEIKKTIKFIICLFLFLQTLGAIFLFFFWQDYFQSVGRNLFYSLFHSASAFSNAGFSLFPDSLERFQGSISINIIFSFLTILGGLGFIVLMDLWQYFIAWLKKQKRKISLYSKIVLITSFILIFLGAGLFFLFEKENLSYLSLEEMTIVSFFQSITRTAGFNTINMENLENPTYMLYFFLMFVGGAPASTAGGIKVITLFLVLFFIYSCFQRKENLIFFKRSISVSVVKKSFMIFSVFLLLVLVFSLILLYTEEAEFRDILFEVFSALGTVGLSTGLTGELSYLGRLIVTLLMFIGRVGPLALIIIVNRRVVDTKIYCPEEQITLG